MAGQSSGQYDTEPHQNNMSVTHQESDLPGRGSFLMLVEDDVEDDGDQTQSTDVDMNSSDSKAKGSKVKCIIGLEDISPTTGNGKGGETRNLCELRRMAIHSSCRRSGYTKLLQECISHAKEKKFDGIKLHTGGRMETTIQFYTSMGFEDMGRLEYTDGNGNTRTIAHLEMIF